RAVVGVDIRGDAVVVGHLADIPDVVEVAVREQHGPRSEPGLGHLLTDLLLRVLARVDDHALSGVVGHDVAIGLEHPGRKTDDLHVPTPFVEGTPEWCTALSASPGSQGPWAGPLCGRLPDDDPPRVQPTVPA